MSLLFSLLAINSDKPLTKQHKMKLLSRVQLFGTPWTIAHQAPPSMEFSRKSTGVGCHFLLHGIFPTQGLSPGLPHCRQMLYRLNHQGSTYSVRVPITSHLFQLLALEVFLVVSYLMGMK